MEGAWAYEGQRLARARLSDADEVSVAQDDGPALRLDGAGFGEVAVGTPPNAALAVSQ